MRAKYYIVSQSSNLFPWYCGTEKASDQWGVSTGRHGGNRYFGEGPSGQLAVKFTISAGLFNSI